MPTRISAITQPRLLIGEGVDEERLLQPLLAHIFRNSPAAVQSIQVGEYDGIDYFEDTLRRIKNRKIPGSGGVKALGILRDADFDAELAFNSVKNALLRVGYTQCPDQPGVFGDGDVKIGVLIVPGIVIPGQCGMLETVCMESISADPAFGCVDAYFKCLKEKHDQAQIKNQPTRVVPHPPNRMAKARAHAWLAGMPKPSKRVGEAAVEGYWNFDHKCFKPLRDFVQNLANIPV